MCDNTTEIHEKSRRSWLTFNLILSSIKPSLSYHTVCTVQTQRPPPPGFASFRHNLIWETPWEILVNVWGQRASVSCLFFKRLLSITRFKPTRWHEPHRLWNLTFFLLTHSYLHVLSQCTAAHSSVWIQTKSRPPVSQKGRASVSGSLSSDRVWVQLHLTRTCKKYQCPHWKHPVEGDRDACRCVSVLTSEHFISVRPPLIVFICVFLELLVFSFEKSKLRRKWTGNGLFVSFITRHHVTNSLMFYR